MTTKHANALTLLAKESENEHFKKYANGINWHEYRMSLLWHIIRTCLLIIKSYNHVE